VTAAMAGGRTVSTGRCSATPASWLRPGSASYSPMKAMTGPPSPHSPITRGRNAGDVLGDAETLVAQLNEMLGGGPRLGVAHFGHAPDLGR